MTSLDPELKRFVDGVEWVFAKTYADTWPHYYIVRDRVDEKRFEELVQFIRKYGVEEPFYDQTYIYLHSDGYVYWTMGDPVEETEITNRCLEEETYTYRLKNGTLPE